MLRLSDLFKDRKKLVIVRRDPSRLTLEEWRGSGVLVKMARKYLENPEFRLMMDVLRNSSYLNYSLAAGMPMEERAFMQARGEGYCACLSNLEALGDYIVPKDSMEATFELPEEDMVND